MSRFMFDSGNNDFTTNTYNQNTDSSYDLGFQVTSSTNSGNNDFTANTAYNQNTDSSYALGFQVTSGANSDNNNFTTNTSNNPSTLYQSIPLCNFSNSNGWSGYTTSNNQDARRRSIPLSGFSGGGGWGGYAAFGSLPQLLTWLSPLDPSLRHREIRERRVNGIGEWLIHTEEFKRWCGEGEGDKAVLFCNGDTGVGKTFISSLVVDRLCDRAGGQNAVVSAFYFDFRARKEQTAASMLGSLVKQVFRTREGILGEILRVVEEQKRTIGGPRPQLVDLVKMLRTIASSRPTFICIDAMDECAGEQRFLLLDSLKQILQQSPGTRIFVTGRPNIRDEIQSRLAGQVINVSISPPKTDIKRYVHARLGQDETFGAMNKILEAEILEKILENIFGSFPLASSSIEAILNESTVSRRRKRLREITFD